jgi:hypothetical protein
MSNNSNIRLAGISGGLSDPRLGEWFEVCRRLVAEPLEKRQRRNWILMLHLACCKEKTEAAHSTQRQ